MPKRIAYKTALKFKNSGVKIFAKIPAYRVGVGGGPYLYVHRETIVSSCKRIEQENHHWRIGFENGMTFNITFRLLDDALACATEIVGYADWPPGRVVVRESIEQVRSVFGSWISQSFGAKRKLAWRPSPPIAIADKTLIPLPEDFPVYDLWEKYPRQEVKDA